MRALVLLALLAAPALAQTPIQPGPDRGWSGVRVAKWALLGAAIGFGGYALVETGRAQSRYEELGHICVTQPDRCRLENGRYADPELEALYAESGRLDKRAQAGIIGAHVTLLGSAGLFIYDLRNGRGPRNIPYPSHGSRGLSRGIVVGARVPF